MPKCAGSLRTAAIWVMDDDNCLLLEREGKDQRTGHSSRSCLLSQRYLTFCVLGKI